MFLVFFAGMALVSLFLDQSVLKKTLVTEEDIAPCSFRSLPCAPNANNILGTDADGRSVLALVVHGSRTSLLVGVAASAITMVVGAAVGIGAGYGRRFTDAVLMRLADFLLVIPWLVLAIVLASNFRRSLLLIIIIIGFTSWPGAARLDPCANAVGA